VVLVVPHSKIVMFVLVSCLYHAIDGGKASSSRSAEGSVRPSEARDRYPRSRNNVSENGGRAEETLSRRR